MNRAMAKIMVLSFLGSMHRVGIYLGIRVGTATEEDISLGIPVGGRSRVQPRVLRLLLLRFSVFGRYRVSYYMFDEYARNSRTNSYLRMFLPCQRDQRQPRGRLRASLAFYREGGALLTGDP